MHRLFDRVLDSDGEDEYYEDSEEEKFRTREMLVDEILEGYDAKLEQEKEKKLQAARSEHEKAVKLAEQRFAKTVISASTTPRQTQAPLPNRRIAHVPSNNNDTKVKSLVHTTKPSTQLFGTPNRTFVKQNNSSPLIKTGSSPQSNQKKVFVRIAQSVAPLKPAVKYGTSPSAGIETVLKTINKVERSDTTTTNRPDDIMNISDPFSDLPSDLLPGLYELPNHGFNEGLNNSIIASDDSSDEDNKMTKTASSSSTPTQGMHVQGKPNEDLQTKTEPMNGRLEHGTDQSSDINPSVDANPSNDNKSPPTDDNGLNDLEGSEEDGPYVVLVIPKHATIDDIMKVLKKAGKGPGTCNEIHKIIAKRKSSSPRRAAIKKRRLEEKKRQLMIEKERLTSTIKQEQLTTTKQDQLTTINQEPLTSIKQEPTEAATELNASGTLTAMSMLVAAEKGIIEDNPVISDPPITPETAVKYESVMANVAHEEFLSQPMLLQDHDYPMLQQHDYSLLQDNDFEKLSAPLQDSEHVEFGLTNDHTYATLMFSYTLPEIAVPLAEPVAEPVAVAEIEVKTEATEVEPVKKIAQVEVPEEVIQDDVQIIEAPTTEVAKEEVVVETIDDDVVMDTDQKDNPTVEIDSQESQNDSADSAIMEPTRWSHRIQNKKTAKSKKPKKRYHSKEKIIPQRPLLPAKYRCRLCEVMYRKVDDMKEHIVEVHSTRKAPVSVTRRRRDKVVNTSAMLSDFEVSALSAVVRLCPSCDKYVPENRIEAHMDNHVPHKQRKIVCDNCGTSCANITNLNVHKRHCQLENRRFKCDDCNNSYPTRSGLQDHRKKHVNENKPVKCDRCAKECRNYRALKSHIAVHFAVKPYECRECGKGFTQKTNMENHRRVHRIETPYQCDMCREVFSHSTSLKTHKKKKHAVNMR